MPVILALLAALGAALLCLVLILSGKFSRRPGRIEELEQRLAHLESTLGELLPLMEVRQERFLEVLPIDPILDEDLKEAQERWDKQFPKRRDSE